MVLVATGIACEIVPARMGFVIAVNDDQADRAREQLAHYAQENRQKRTPSPADDWATLARGLPAIVLFAGVLLIVDSLQRNQAFGLDWLWAGKSHAGLIRGGEWWRCFTALTLHADIAHLGNNVGFGSLFGIFVSQISGAGVGWLSILLAGALGNGFNAYFQLGSHTSVGASTAVFAALGLLAMHGLLHGRRHEHRWRWRLLPIAAAIGLLGFIGTGGERTDIYAHFFGFTSGLIIGFPLSRYHRLFPRAGSWQLSFGLIALILIAIAWWLALSIQG